MFRSMNHIRPRSLAQRPQRRLKLESLECRITPSTLLVDDDRHQFPNAPYTTIQSAVDAAQPGDRILVATGNYREQVVIGEGKDDLDIRSAGHATIIAPDNYGDDSRAIVHIDGASGVDLERFVIRGNGAAIGPNFGVLVDGGGSADIQGNRILGIADAPLSGRQEGVGIQFGQFTDGGPGSGSARGNTIEGYQKGGIVVIGDGSSAQVTGNSIRGVGATAVIAQNGIQISDGATATVTGNTVSGNKYTGPDFESIGILVFDSSNVRIRGNFVSNNDEGIVLFGDAGPVTNVTVEGNTATGNVINGIGLFNVTDSVVRLNKASFNGSDGINLENSTDNEISHNLAFHNDRYGIALEADATANIIRHNVMFFNAEFDAFDASTGNGTAGTANIWSRNVFRTSNPNGLR